MSFNHYILKLDSRDSVNKLTTNPIQVTFNNQSSSHIERIILKNASIPNVFYNIDQNKNKIVLENIGVHTVIFPTGHYNINSLLSYFNNSIEAITAGVTIEFDSLLNKLVFNAVIDTTINKNTSNMFYVLGLNESSNFNIVSNIPKYSDYMSDLSGVRNIHVETNFSKMNTLQTNGYKSYIANIPVDVPFGAIIHYTNQEQSLDQIVRSQTYSQNMNNVIISLRDASGELLNLQNMHWEINFKISVSNDHILFD